MEKVSGGALGSLYVVRVFGADGGGLVPQVLHLGKAQQQRLAAGFGGAAVAIDANVQGIAYGL